MLALDKILWTVDYEWELLHVDYSGDENGHQVRSYQARTKIAPHDTTQPHNQMIGNTFSMII